MVPTSLCLMTCLCSCHKLVLDDVDSAHKLVLDDVDSAHKLVLDDVSGLGERAREFVVRACGVAQRLRDRSSRYAGTVNESTRFNVQGLAAGRASSWC
jgi:hypothetical protein